MFPTVGLGEIINGSSIPIVVSSTRITSITTTSSITYSSPLGNVSSSL